MNNSISKSMNMRTLKEAMADQFESEQSIEIYTEEETAITEYSDNPTPPMERMNNNMDELDKTVQEHITQSDEVIDKAMDGFDAIFTLAQSVPPDKSARLFEVAAQYLDIVNKTSDSKVTAKHDKAKLSVSLAKAQIQAGMVETAVNNGIKAHRNDILKAIMGGDSIEADFTESKEISDSEDDKYSKDPEEKK